MLAQQGHSLGSGVKSAPPHMPFSTGTNSQSPERKHVWAGGSPLTERTCHLDRTHTLHSHLPCPHSPLRLEGIGKAQQAEQTRAAGGRRGEGPQAPVQRQPPPPGCLSVSSGSCSPKGSSPGEPQWPLLIFYHQVSRMSSSISLISPLLFFFF